MRSGDDVLGETSPPVALRNHHRTDLVVVGKNLAHAGHEQIEVAVAVEVDRLDMGDARQCAQQNLPAPQTRPVRSAAAR